MLKFNFDEYIFRWTFKLYDKDGSGEIDPDEMEDIFKKLCKIAAGIEADQSKILAKVHKKYCTPTLKSHFLT